MNTSRKGRRGEAAAAQFLQGHGYRIIARNYRTPDGEIDLICLDGRVLVFVEVKARSNGAFGTALSAVHRHKRAKLRALAADFAQLCAPGLLMRFDIVAIDGNRLTLYRNAF